MSTFSKLEIGLVIVPGGGPFADQVRTASCDWDLPESCAHDMAVLGMQQYAHMLVGLTDNIRLVETLQELIDAIANQHVVVWAPYLEVTRATDLKKNWQTTSDSIAIWLAAKINARNLLLIKSAKVAEKSIQQLIEEKIVDQCFSSYLKNYSGHVKFLHAADANRFLDCVSHGQFI